MPGNRQRGVCPTHPTMTTYPKTKRRTRRWGPRSTHAVPYRVDPTPKSVEHDPFRQSNLSTRERHETVVRFPEIDKGPAEPDLSHLLVRARTDADVHHDMTIDSGVTDLNRSSSRKRGICNGAWRIQGLLEENDWARNVQVVELPTYLCPTSVKVMQ